ncbi:hypothetical protein MTO96_005667 [Rhipicephalus appendiculatus]
MRARTVADQATDTTCAPTPKVASAQGAATSTNGKMFPPVSRAAFSVGGQHLTGAGSCKARNPTAKRHSPPPQKTKFPTKVDFPPLGKTHPSTSAWSSGAARANGTTSQDSEVKALWEEPHHPDPSFAPPPYNMAPPTGHNSL